eukprot:5597195-Prymnesium_polylepis.1
MVAVTRRSGVSVAMDASDEGGAGNDDCEVRRATASSPGPTRWAADLSGSASPHHSSRAQPATATAAVQPATAYSITRCHALTFASRRRSATRSHALAPTRSHALARVRQCSRVRHRAA